VSKEEFIEAMGKMGFEGDAARVFRLYDIDGGGAINLEEIDPKAYDAMMRGDDLLGLDVEQPKESMKGKSFLDRQKTGASARQEALGKAQRKAVEDAEAAKKAKDIGASTLEGLKGQLVRKYGNMYRAWLFLDGDGSGKLSFVEFCQACRNEGYSGNLKSLWKELDADGEGFVTLAEFAPEVAALTQSFLQCLKDKHEGSLVKAWKLSLDSDKSGSITKDEFAAAMQKLGWEGDCNRCFRLFDVDGGGSITLEEIDPRAYAAMLAGLDEGGFDVQEQGKKKSEMTFEERQALASKKKDFSGKQQRQAVADAEAAQKAKDIGASDFAGFKAQLGRKYGNLLRAWRMGLDTDGSGKLSFVEFCNAARAEGFAGNLKALWKEMDSDGEGFVSMAEFAPDVAALVDSFMKCLKHHGEGSIIKAWKKHLDTDKSGSVSKEEFIEAMGKMGFEGDAARVFRLYDIDGGGAINLEEIDPKAYAAMLRGDDLLGLDVEEEGAQKKSEMSFLDRQKTNAAKRQEAIGKATRKELEDAEAAEKAKSMGASTLAAFKKQLVLKYGNLLRAWKSSLDADGSGKLSQNEFFGAARNEGYVGNLKGLWKELDGGDGGDGFITLAEFAPEIAQLLDSFKQMIQDKFEGSLEKAWKQSLDADRSGNVSKEEFVQAMQSIGWDGDAARLFGLYDFDRSGYISLAEMDA